MRIKFAHYKTQGIDYAVFNADAVSNLNSDRIEILNDLTNSARCNGFKIDKSALAFREGGRTKLYGDDDLVKFLSNQGIPRWTHSIDA